MIAMDPSCSNDAVVVLIFPTVLLDSNASNGRAGRPVVRSKCRMFESLKE